MKKHVRFTLTAVLVLSSMVLFAFAQQVDTATGQDYDHRAAVAVQNGDFEKAIAFWQKAIPLDHGRDVKCRGEFERNSIKAAKDTISMLQQGKLQRAEAVKWFNNHSIELWMPNVCNSN